MNLLLGPTVVCALSLLVRMNGLVDLTDPHFRGWDSHSYVAMAETPFAATSETRVAPFCWRILAPWLAHVLPVPRIEAFWLLTTGSLMIAAENVRALLVRLGGAPTSVSFGTLAFCLLGPATAYSMHAPMFPDAVSFALMTLQVRMAMAARPALFLMVTIAAALAKETALLGCVFALFWSFTADRRMRPYAVAGIGIFAVVTFGLRMAIPKSNGYTVIAEFWRVHSPFDPHAEFRRLFASVGHTWSLLLAPAAMWFVRARRSPAWLPLLALAAIAYGQLVIAISVERIIVYAFPAVIAGAALEIEWRWSGRDRVIAWYLVCLSLVPGFLNHANVFLTHGKAAPRFLTVLAAVSTITTGAATAYFLYYGASVDATSRSRGEPAAEEPS